MKFSLKHKECVLQKSSPKMNKNWLLTILLVLTSQVVQSQRNTETLYFDHDGYERSCELYVPENFSQKNTYPVVLILHGGGGTAKGLIRSTRGRFNQLADQYGFVAVYPNGYGKSWNDGARDTFGVARNLNIDDVGFIGKVLEDLDKKMNVDQHYIFACGISNGGFMAQRLAFELSGKIRGIAVVAANLSEVQSEKKFPDNPVSVLFINGTADPLVPYNGGDVTVFRQKRGKIKSVDESLDTWRKINGCSETEVTTSFPDKNKTDGCTAVKTVYRNPENPEVKVAAIKVINGGHSWPGSTQNLPVRLVGNTCRDFNGCDEIWSFFHSLMNLK